MLVGYTGKRSVFLHRLRIFLAQTLRQWDAYPVLPPTANFPPVKLDQGFYYVNAFEP